MYAGKLEEARTILKDAIKRLEESASAQQDFCKVQSNIIIIVRLALIARDEKV